MQPVSYNINNWGQPATKLATTVDKRRDNIDGGDTRTEECSQCFVSVSRRRHANKHFFYSGPNTNPNVQPLWEFNLNDYYGLPQDNSGNKKAAHILPSQCRSYCLDDVVPPYNVVDHVVPPLLVEPVSPSASEMLKNEQPSSSESRQRSKDSESPRWNTDEQWQSPRPIMASLSDSPKFVGSLGTPPRHDAMGTPPRHDTSMSKPEMCSQRVILSPSSDSEDWNNADWNDSRIDAAFDWNNNKVETVGLNSLDEICPDVPELPFELDGRFGIQNVIQKPTKWPKWPEPVPRPGTV